LGTKTEGVTVKRDGVELGAGSLGTPLPVEPGKHVVSVSAPGHATKTFEVTLAEAEQKSLAVDVGPEGSPDASTNPAPDGPKSNGLRTVGWIVGGVGAAAVATGVVFTLLALGDNSKSKPGCDGSICADQPSLDARNDARAKGNVATGLFIGGGVLVGAG